MRQPPGTRFTRRTPPTFDRLGRRPSRQPLLLIGAAAVFLALAWLLFLPPFALLRGGGGWQQAGEGSLVRRRTDVPRPPEGFQLASAFYEIRQERGIGPATMTIPLDPGKAGRGLALFTYSGGSWRRLAPAEVTPDGRAARGQVDQVPENVAVMRRLSGGFQVQGILKPGTPLHPDAEKLLTVLSPADYMPAPDGSVNGAPSPRPASDSVALVPVVSATAGAEKDAVNAILASETARATHVAELVKLVQNNRLDGLDLEYTAIDPTLGGAYLSLVTTLADQLHKTGQTLTVTLPLPRREGNNWNTFGYDWKELARVADYVRIAPERDQSIYRRVLREALNYITGVVDSKKVILTLSPLASERSEQGTRTLTALEALSVAAQFTVRDRDRLVANGEVQVTADNLNREGAGGRAGLIWDANAAAVSFVYQAGESLRTVWIENAFSAAFKLEFVQLWDLGGVAVDDASASEGMANIWPAIEQFQRTGAPTLLQPNGGLLQPQWLVDGQSKEVGKAVFTWKAPPDPGDHTISLVVGDGVMRVVNNQRITLRAGPPTAASPTATPGRSPTATR
jgi:hypothetical protein